MRTVLTLIAALFIFGDTVAIAQPAPDATTMPAANGAGIAERLERYRHFIGNVEDSNGTRIAQAEELLTTGWPEATPLAVQLLTAPEHPSTRVIMCRAIANVGRAAQMEPDQGLVPPLLNLLGSTDAETATCAGEALAAFPDGKVVHELSKLAADAEAPQQQRLAALAALIPNMDRREVVGELIQLLDSKAPAIREVVLHALDRLTPQSFGEDINAWKAWWQEQSTLSDNEWLRRQVTHHAARLAALERDLEAMRKAASERHTQLAARLAQALTYNYRLTPQAEREALLIRWLEDPVPETRRVAASLIAEQISEGDSPSVALRNALRLRYNDSSADVRKLAMEIIGSLNDPADAEPMLARLEVERDPGVRETVLRVLGKLRNPTSLGPLLAELQRPDAPEGCLAAAAEAIGMLAARAPFDEATRQSLVAPLKTHFAQSEGGPARVRVALLGAMAALGMPEFRPEFETNLNSDSPELLLRAIQGIATVGDGDLLDRMSNLTTHADARVRQRALEALAALGTEEQMATIVARLSPSVEAIEGPRQAAWQAFLQISKRLPLARQIAAADRLVDHPTLAADYLKRLHEEMSSTKPAPAELPAVRERLALLNDALERPCEALPLWRQLHTAAVYAADPRMHEFALAQLRSALACDKPDRIDADLLALQDAEASLKDAAVKAVTDYLKRIDGPQDVHRRADVIAALRTLPENAFPALTYFIADESANEAATQPAGAG